MYFSVLYKCKSVFCHKILNNNKEFKQKFKSKS